MSKIIDTHIHLNVEEYAQNYSELIAEAQTQGIVKFIVPGTDLISSQSAVRMSQENEAIVAAGGIHPHEALKASEDDLEKIKVLAKDLVAIGEVGLDYYYDFSPKDIQKQCFSDNIDLACQLDLPLIIHCREADGDLLDILQNSSLPSKVGVIHCCSSAWEYVSKYLDLGFYIGITGMVTFKKALFTQEAALKTPLERLLVETDGPYLAPVPHRGSILRPVWIRDTISYIAKLRGLNEEEFIEATYANACKLFTIS
ncbi:TatD family hydrolase [bacterium]|nr:TatD family hydrolase [bacterium]